MAEESFILVNLKESKAKKLAQVISNETSRKILDFLTTKKEASESEISTQLKIPISTAHYSLKHLKEVNLVFSEEFHYSKKGKVVEHYKLSNKTVIIAPHQPNMESFKEKLKKILPAFFVSILGTLGIFISKNFNKTQTFVQQDVMMARSVVEETAGAGIMAEPIVQEQGNNFVSFLIQNSSALWFFAGALIAISSYVVIDYIIEKNKKHGK